MFFGTIGGIPELDAKGINNDETATGGQGFLDPRLDVGDQPPGTTVGHPLFEDEIGPRTLLYNPVTDMVPREPAAIIHNARPSPTEDAGTVAVSSSVTTKGPHVKSLIGQTGPKAATPPFTVKVVENPLRSTYPDTGLANTELSFSRKLDYLKEPTTNRLARGIRGNTDTSDPRVSGIVFEKMENRKAGQLKLLQQMVKLGLNLKSLGKQSIHTTMFIKQRVDILLRWMIHLIGKGCIGIIELVLLRRYILLELKLIRL